MARGRNGKVIPNRDVMNEFERRFTVRRGRIVKRDPDEPRFDRGGGFDPYGKTREIPRPKLRKPKKRSERPGFIPFLDSDDVEEGQRAAAGDRQ